MGEKRIPRFFTTMQLIIPLFALNFTSLHLIGCGADETETENQITELTDEEQKKLLRFVEYVLFPTTPYIDKSWVEIVPEEEVAEAFIDFATETAAIQQTFNEFYNAYKAGDVRTILANFYSHGLIFQCVDHGVVQTKFSMATMKSSLESGCGIPWGTPVLTEFYIRRQNVQAPYPEASAHNSSGIYVYLIKQGNKWLINQFGIRTTAAIRKYFDDPKYKAP